MAGWRTALVVLLAALLVTGCGDPWQRRHNEALFLISAGHAAAGMALMRELAVAGHPRSQVYLGVSIATGRLAERDREAGGEWIRQAAAGGDVPGRYLYAEMLFVGALGAEQDQAGGIALMQDLAEAGLVPAMVRLADYHSVLNDTESGSEAARYWLTRAAQAGHPGARRRLQRM